MMTPKERAELEQLRKDVNCLLQMYGVPPVKVNWNNGVPVINPDPEQNIPVIISGYSSGIGMSGQGVYWWQEQDFDRTGGRFTKTPGLQGYVSSSGVMYGSGTLSSGLMASSGFIAASSGILSGIAVNPLYETNGRIITDFPYYGWARRRSQTNVVSGPGQTYGVAYEFDYTISGAVGGGGSGPINVLQLSQGVVVSGNTVNGVTNIGFSRCDVLSGIAGIPSATATVSPHLATYYLTGMWPGIEDGWSYGGPLSSGTNAPLMGGATLCAVESVHNPCLKLTTVSPYSGTINGAYASDGALNCENDIEVVPSPGTYSGVYSGSLLMQNAGNLCSIGYTATDWSGNAVVSLGFEFLSGTQSAPGLGSGPIPIGFSMYNGGLDRNGGLYVDGPIKAQGDIFANVAVTAGTSVGSPGMFVAWNGANEYQGKYGSLGPFGNTVGGGIVSDLGSGTFAGYRVTTPTASTSPGIVGEFSVVYVTGKPVGIAAYTAASGWIICSGTCF